MDETGYLQEGEVYCSVYKEEEGDSVIEGQIVVTRCPALHPGDIQCVTAVDVPSDNPMKALHHVVAFSSHGQRDLPSMLSGGDLDGDLYNIIYDHALYPKRLAEPADYPTVTPIDIGKPVDKSDMTEHFIKFMENDNLGLIATLHQILADRSPDGTFDPDCLVLASLHSTAVDFSKTGIPVRQRNALSGHWFLPRVLISSRLLSRKCRDIQNIVLISKPRAPALRLRRGSALKTRKIHLLLTTTTNSNRWRNMALRNIGSMKARKFLESFFVT